jgi:hypothetical protein
MGRTIFLLVVLVTATALLAWQLMPAPAADITTGTQNKLGVALTSQTAAAEICDNIDLIGGVTAGTGLASHAVILDSNGAFTMPNGGDITAATAGGSDLGSATGEWGDIYLLDDKSIILGSGQDVELLWSDADASNHAAVLGLGNSNEVLHICDLASVATDWNVSANAADSEVWIHSVTTPATDYLRIGAHDGTDAYLDVVGGTGLNFAIAATTIAEVTTAGIGMKVDDDGYFVGASDDAGFVWQDGDADNHAAVLALGNTSQQLHVTDVAAIATDWARSAGTHPEVAIHSNTTPATDYLAIGNHDGSSAQINLVGGYSLNVDAGDGEHAYLKLESPTILDHTETYDMFEDFNMKALDETNENWLLNSGSDDLAVDPAVVIAEEGTIFLDAGDGDGAIAVDGSQIIWMIPVQADSGGLVVEARLHIEDITGCSVNVGLTDENGTTCEEPFSIAGGTITSVAADAVCFVFDDGATTKEWYMCGVDGGTDATGNAATGTAPVNGAYQTFRIEIDADGEGAEFFINGASEGSLTASVCAASTNLYLTVVICGDAGNGAAVGCTVDYLRVSHTR